MSRTVPERRPTSSGGSAGAAPKSIGPYRILRRIGDGGMAELFLADKTSKHGFIRRAVIKQVKRGRPDTKQLQRMLLDEARANAYFDHPNLVSVLDIGDTDRGLYLALEYVDGTDLRRVNTRLRARREALPFELAAFLVGEVLRGAHHAHIARGKDGQPLEIIHRDINPSNVLISRSGHVKLTDFGVVRMRERVQPKTEPGLVKGKYAYLAPEYIAGESCSMQTDLYAAGIMLFELLSGRECFTGATAYEVMWKIVNKGVPMYRLQREGVPEGLQRIVARATEMAPERRYESAQEMANALEAWLMRSGRHATPWVLSVFFERHELFPDDIEAVTQDLPYELPSQMAKPSLHADPGANNSEVRASFRPDSSGVDLSLTPGAKSRVGAAPSDLTPTPIIDLEQVAQATQQILPVTPAPLFDGGSAQQPAFQHPAPRAQSPTPRAPSSAPGLPVSTSRPDSPAPRASSSAPRSASAPQASLSPPRAASPAPQSPAPTPLTGAERVAAALERAPSPPRPEHSWPTDPRPSAWSADPRPASTPSDPAAVVLPSFSMPGGPNKAPSVPPPPSAPLLDLDAVNKAARVPPVAIKPAPTQAPKPIPPPDVEPPIAAPPPTQAPAPIPPAEVEPVAGRSPTPAPAPADTPSKAQPLEPAAEVPSGSFSSVPAGTPTPVVPLRASSEKAGAAPESNPKDALAATFSESGQVSSEPPTLAPAAPPAQLPPSSLSSDIGAPVAPAPSSTPALRAPSAGDLPPLRTNSAVSRPPGRGLDLSSAFKEGEGSAEDPADQAQLSELSAPAQLPPSTSPAPVPAPLAGKLEDTPAATVIEQLVRDKADGEVEFRCGLIWKRVRFDRGMPVGVTSNMGMELIGEHLVKARIIHREALDQALIAAERAGSSLTDELLKRHLVDQETLEHELGENISARLREVLQWRWGTFEFTELHAEPMRVIPRLDLDALLQRPQDPASAPSEAAREPASDLESALQAARDIADNSSGRGRVDRTWRPGR